MPLDLKHQTLKDAVLDCQTRIRDAETEMALLRLPCEHPATYKAYWQWGGPGRMFPAHVCQACLLAVKPLEGEELKSFMEEREAEVADFKRQCEGTP